MKLNTPNKLTILRVCLIPFFVAFLSIDSIPHRYLWALVFFGIASFTDYLDGHLARKYHLITNFGKFLDPLADKLLVISAFMCFVDAGILSAVVVIVTIAREFLVTSVRLVANGEGVVIAADIWGKIKTVSQIICICTLMIEPYLDRLLCYIDPTYFFAHFYPLSWLTTVVMLVFTLLSGINYIYANRKALTANW